MKKNYKKIILGIETSCDETAAAVVEVARGKKQAPSFHILSNIVWSQISIHKKFGGIVPEVAARNHIKNILPVIDLAMKEAHKKPKDIDHITVTRGPGLITSLLVGLETAKHLAFVWKKPISGINHLKGHIYSAWVPSEQKNKEATSYQLQARSFPLIALVVSGGHTELILMKNEKHMKKIGQTLDDAAGEAFDKVAKILGLGYPGGPEISKMAGKRNSNAFDFPRPMIQSKNLDFSFSGLKTAVLYTTKKLGDKETKKQLYDLCASFQQAVIDVLVSKTIRAAKQYKAKTVILTGGVAANKELRLQLAEKFNAMKIPLIVPSFTLCTDNAVMSAMAGYFEKPIPWQKLRVDANLEI